jgi:hypothetical protein
LIHATTLYNRTITYHLSLITYFVVESSRVKSKLLEIHAPIAEKISDK